MQLSPLRTHRLWVNFGLNCLSGPQGRAWMTPALSWGCRGVGPVGTWPRKPLPQCILMAVAAAASGSGVVGSAPYCSPRRGLFNPSSAPGRGSVSRAECERPLCHLLCHISRTLESSPCSGLQVRPASDQDCCPQVLLPLPLLPFSCSQSHSGLSWALTTIHDFSQSSQEQTWNP